MIFCHLTILVLVTTCAQYIHIQPIPVSLSLVFIRLGIGDLLYNLLPYISMYIPLILYTSNLLLYTESCFHKWSYCKDIVTKRNVIHFTKFWNLYLSIIFCLGSTKGYNCIFFVYST